MKENSTENFTKFLESEAEVFPRDESLRGPQSAHLEKLALSCLDKPSDWVLKIVQAAVLVGAGKLSFKLGRSAIEVTFFLSEPIALVQIQDSLLNPSKEQTAFAKEMNVALRTLLPSNTFRLMNTQGESLRWDGESLSCDAVPVRPGGSKLSLIVRRNTSKTALVSSSLRRAYDAIMLGRTLRQRAVYAPLTLMLDGQVLSTDTFALKNRMSKFEAELHLHLLRAQISDDKTWEPGRDKVQLSDQGLSADRPGSGEPFLKLLSPSRPAYHLELFCGFKESELVGQAPDTLKQGLRQGVPQALDLQFTRLGVVCATHTLKEKKLGGLLVTEGSPLHADFTGLKMDVDPASWTRLEQKLQRALPLLEFLASQARFHPATSDVSEQELGQIADWVEAFGRELVTISED